MYVELIELVYGDAEIALAICVDSQKQHEAFELYSAYGGQEGIPRRVFPTADPRTTTNVVTIGSYSARQGTARY